MPNAIRLFAGVLTACVGSVTYGTWLIYPPAGFIIGGILVAGLAFLVLTE